MASTDEVNEYLDAKFDPSTDKSIEGVPDNPGVWWHLVNMEPALLRGLVVGVFSLLAATGLFVSDNLQAAIAGLVFAIVAVLQGISTRKASTPNAKVVVYKPDPVLFPHYVKPGPAVSTDVQQVANAAADLPSPVKDFSELPFPTRR